MIIGVSGKLRSGKDSAAGVLTAAGWHQASFAAALKLFVYRLNPLIPNESGSRYYRYAELVDCEGLESVKDNYPEARALLQRCGTDAGRVTLGDNVWVDAAFASLPADKDVVFTDCRFVNEADAIRDRGGMVIRVERDGLPTNTHPSETALDGYDFDAVLHNNGTIEELHEAMVDAVRSAPVRLAVNALRD